MAQRAWDDIPVDHWDHATFRIDDEGGWSLEFNYTGLNGHQYHFPETEIEYEEFEFLYDQLYFWDIEFDIEY